jgi:acetyl-CoA acetyltransferase
LRREDIDGLATYPGMGSGTSGFAGPTSPEVQDALGLSLNWHDGGGEGPGQMRAVMTACLAVAAGLARHVLVYRTVSEGTAQGTGGRQGIGGTGGGGHGVPRFGGFLQWSLPYGAVSAANWIAMVGQRRMHEFGLTREQLAQIALNGRRNAALNPNAVYTDPLSLDDYLAARMITTPLCLLDCDAPCDGSTAVIVSHRDHAGSLDHPAVHVHALGTALRGRPSWDQYEDMTTMAAHDAGTSLWERADLVPSDVDTAQLYDGFSILAIVWLEALRFCGRGESGSFIEGGTAIARDGLLPLNTAGGQLSGGRLHGFGFIHEACVQLRGEGGPRQVVRPGGRMPEVAAVANGGGPIAGAMLLTRGTG